MSAFSCATMESIGTVGCDVNHSEPYSPSSSPVCHTNSIDRRGAGRCATAARAMARSATLPVPSSSAPFATESPSSGGWIPMWSRCAPNATYDPRSAASAPRRIPTTLNAGTLVNR
jgi:hypothetical protein